VHFTVRRVQSLSACTTVHFTVRPVQSLRACTRVHFTLPFILVNSICVLEKWLEWEPDAVLADCNARVNLISDSPHRLDTNIFYFLFVSVQEKEWHSKYFI
jgi:hypothetical protein